MGFIERIGILDFFRKKGEPEFIFHSSDSGNLNSLLGEFRQELDTIESQIARMRLMMAEMSTSDDSGKDGKDMGEMSDKLKTNDEKIESYLKMLEGCNSDEIASEESRASSEVKSIDDLAVSGCKLTDAEPDKHFRVFGGSTAGNLKELYAAIKSMDDRRLAMHFNAMRNDFAAWAKDALSEHELADRLDKATTKEELLLALGRHI